MSRQMDVRMLAALALSVALSVSAETTTQGQRRSLSLQECVSLALTRNLDLQIQQLNSQIARYDLNAAYGIYIPLFSFEGRHDSISQPGNFDPQKFNPDFPYTLNSDTFGPLITGRLPIGLSYELAGSASTRDARTDFSSDPENGAPYFFGIRETNNAVANASITARQKLLRDFWIDQDRLTIVLNRKTLKSSQQALKFQVMRTVLAVEMAYYDVISAREKVRAQETALETTQQLLAEMRRRVEVGDIPALDADQAETQVQTTLTALYAAREQLSAQQNIVKSLVTDNFVEWADTEFIPADPLLAVAPELNRSESFQRALKTRPDLEEARIAIEKSDAVVQFRYNQLFPSLDLIGRYGGAGVSTDVGGAIGDVGELKDPQYFYGAVLTLPFSNSRERNAYHASKAARQVSELQLKRVEEAVLLQVADWVNRVESRYKQVGSTRLARSYADSALKAEQKKLANGLTTPFVVLQLHQALVEASTAESQALAEYNKALAQLSFAEGSILEKHRLTVQLK